jgi:queuine/archaeosine tRNA-ribosyltransferase
MAALSVGTHDGEARTGTLRTSHGTLATPALLLHTSRGLPPFLTLDNLATLRPQAAALQLCLAHLYDRPSPTRFACAPPPHRPRLKPYSSPQLWHPGAHSVPHRR